MSTPSDGSRVLDPDDPIEEEIGTDASEERTRMSFLDHLDELVAREVPEVVGVEFVHAAAESFFAESIGVAPEVGRDGGAHILRHGTITIRVEDFFALRVSPDIDIASHTLAHAADAAKGRGPNGEPVHAPGAPRCAAAATTA